ncbi:MAG: hypothetical protein EHM48_01145 [Planctomycetaceae bacterium]|nr:MAG: hypothetical protein EHM48_01145 [Planctomycetaceae bacterium]
MDLMACTRAEKEKLAAALVEKARRAVGYSGDTDAALDLLTWSTLRRASLKTGTIFDLVRHRYLRDIYATTAREMCIYKASQMGASEYAVSYALHAADERDATVLYVFPTDTHVSDFSAARIGPAIEASPYLESIVVEGGAAAGGGDGRKLRGADRVTLKRIRNRFMYLRGGQVTPKGMAPQLKSIDADVLVLDEVDEMDPRAPSIAEKRLGHSSIGEQRWISTPTYHGIGIHAKWLESDQREWHVKCDACNDLQPLTIDRLVVEWDDLGRPTRWNDALLCRKCSAPLNHLGPGQWVAAFPGRDVIGFHLTKLFSSTVRLIDIVRALDTTDETKRREAYNQDLGEPYTPRGGQLTDIILDDCRREYAHGPVRGEKTVMGVDVGKVLHVVIRGPANPETGERPQRFAGEVESFEELGRKMKTFDVERAVIDALPETRKAREFQEAFKPGIVWVAYYVSQKTGLRTSDPSHWDADKGVVNLDRTRLLDMTFSRFYEQENTIPGYARDVRDYYAHLKAPVRTLEDGPGGEKVAVYIESGPDHLAHAENYCTVASMTPPIKRAGVWGR